MKFRMWAGMAVFLGALLLAACGGGGDDDTSSSSGTSTGGSGGGGDSSVKVNNSTGSDEKFVADVCKAYKTFADDLSKAQANAANVKNEADAAKLFSDPLEKLVAAFAKASPPKDLKEWHAAAAKQMSDTVASLKKGGDLSAFGDVAALADPPQDAIDRLTKIADKNQDCKDSSFSFSK